MNTAAACLAAGAAGVVLDAQVFLAREAQLPEDTRQWLASCDGSETLTLGDRLGEAYRFFARPGSPGLKHLAQEEERLSLASASGSESRGASGSEQRLAWRGVVAETVRRGPEQGIFLVGQDAAHAKLWSDRYITVGSMIHGLCERVTQNLQSARTCKPLAETSLLAQRHRTRYPIVQGPMTRVSDTAPFADAVARAGGLPFLALALLRKAETEKLLAETKALLGERSWGVGILGFVPQEIRQEQIEGIRKYKPPFALIAGGRPDQARELEKEGIPTYLHVPSPGLLRMFLKDGARRFVFEGRECGGHVGPRTSFVLWETMCEILLEYIGPLTQPSPQGGEGSKGGKGDELHVIFAGGIHDAVSSAMVAALAAPLAQRGVAIGALMGTAYLFTQEAVAAGAIVPRFQKEALSCRETVLFQTGPGHAIRCIPTPYHEAFETEKLKLQKEGRSHEEITRSLEWMNLGRLRVASKGVDRVQGGTDPSALAALPDSDQFNRGMYMIGQVAGLRDRVVSMEELHADVAGGGTRILERLPAPETKEEPAPRPCDIAVIGMACFYPRSLSLESYWNNILNKVNAVTEIPPTHWDWRLYYDADPRARDKIISKWGAFLEDILFDPLTYGITPASLNSIEPLQLYMLEAVRHALRDAGYSDRAFPRDRTAAILGTGGGGGPVGVQYGFRTCLPLLESVPEMRGTSSSMMESCKSFLPEWTEDSFPGILMNVVVGRVANRFNFGGPNYAIDAACGSSLAALYACVRELEMGTSDVALAMGADTVMTPYAYMAFSKTHALSPRGQCRPFDAAADGIALSEGVSVVVLKRLADAQRDGDRIYAIVKGVGASSDGKDKGLTAPRAEGQLRALRRAYGQAGISPARVGLIEAHGTGTVVGDQTEALALTQILQEGGAPLGSCALGSVKSMIGHSKCAAGLAGFIKTALGLYHKILPPTLVESPNPKCRFDQGPLFLNAEPRPWVHGSGQPRVAGISAFGFGGTNFHVVAEEYVGDFLEEAESALPEWPAELLVFSRPTREALVQTVEVCLNGLRAAPRARSASEGKPAVGEGTGPRLADIAYSLWKTSLPRADQPTLAVVATSVDDLKEKLGLALENLRASLASASGSKTKTDWQDPRGLYYSDQPEAKHGKIAFLFPGQGSQYPNMLAQAAMAFPEVRQAFDHAEQVLHDLDRPLGKFVYPPSTFSPAQEEDARKGLTRTEIAQPAIGAAGLGMCHLLQGLGLEPDFLAGHSYGEYVALCAAGALSEDDLIRLSYRRGKVLAEATHQAPGGMAAFDADADKVMELFRELKGVTLANSNAPNQTVISGTEESLGLALEHAKGKGVRGQRLPVSCGFHSPLVAAARDPLAQALSACRFQPMGRTVYANTTGQPYPNDPAAIAKLLADHLVSPVLFQKQIEQMYEAGARIFIEVGPQSVLTGLAHAILGPKPHLAVASDQKSRPGLVQLAHLLGQLLVHGVTMDLGRIFKGRKLRSLDLARLDQETGDAKITPTTWVVNGVRNRPYNAPEPKLLGQPWDESSPAAKPADSKPAASSSRAAGHKPAVPAASAPRPAQPAARSLHANSDAPPVADVMLRFQDLMAKFLDTQKSVMTSYLSGGSEPAHLSNGLAAAISANGDHTLETAIHENGTPLSVKPAAEEAVPAANGSVVAADVASSNGHAPAGINREWLHGQLMDMLSQRTGYPKEMLGMDLDLEADLGVDSIKRVEILGTLAESMGGGNADGSAAGQLDMEKLTGLKTLRGILDYLEPIFSKNGQTHEKQEAKAAAPQSAAADFAVQRARVRLVEAPLPSSASLVLPSGTVLFTDDGRGIAQAAAQRLAEFGLRSVFLHHSSSPAAGAPFTANLTDPKAVTELLARLRQEVGPIAGLVHLLPFAQPAEGASATDRMARDVLSLYLLCRGLEEDLRRAGKDGGAVLLAGAALGGGLAFGDEPLPADFFAGHGGIIGFVKCVAYEWPEVLVRVVDVDGGKAPSEIADRILGELSDADGPLEVGYQGNRRVTWEPASAPLVADPAAAPLLEKGDTVLITGGARGITARVALELAHRYQPNLVIVGRSPLPEEQEAAETASLTTAGDIKAALMQRLEREGRAVVPALVESAYQRILQDREMRATLAGIRQTGGRVVYQQMDVRDEAAMAKLLADLDQAGLRGVIHGAGVIEDKLLRDKTPESFERIFGTKTESALILSRHLRPEKLKFLVFFSSIASRFGNKGQADYAAANEMLSKLALELDRRWPCRVVSIAWGPWSGTGMVAHLEPHLVRRGLKMISPEQGPVFVIDELLYGKKGDGEIIIAGGGEQMARPARRAKAEKVTVGLT